MADEGVSEAIYRRRLVTAKKVASSRLGLCVDACAIASVTSGANCEPDPSSSAMHSFIDTRWKRSCGVLSRLPKTLCLPNLALPMFGLLSVPHFWTEVDCCNWGWSMVLCQSGRRNNIPIVCSILASRRETQKKPVADFPSKHNIAATYLHHYDLFFCPNWDNIKYGGSLSPRLGFRFACIRNDVAPITRSTPPY